MPKTLRAYRQANDLTLAALAAKVGITESTLSRIERTGRVSSHTARALARVTGLTMEEVCTPPADAEA